MGMNQNTKNPSRDKTMNYERLLSFFLKNVKLNQYGM